MENRLRDKHGYSADTVEALADAIIALHTHPQVSLKRDEIIEALRTTGAGPQKGPATVKIAVDVPWRLEDVTVARTYIDIGRTRYSMSPSITGLHASLPADPHALERLRAAVARRHERYGSRLPVAAEISQWETGCSYAIPGLADAATHRSAIAHQEAQMLDSLAHIIIHHATMLDKHRDGLLAADVEAPRRARALLRMADDDEVSTARLPAIDTQGNAPVVKYAVKAKGLTSTLKNDVIELEMTCRLDGAWEMAEAAGFVRHQKVRRRRLRARAPDRGMTVDGVLARHLLAQRNRTPARHLLFSMAQGVVMRQTDVGGVSNAQAVDGRLTARLVVGAKGSWRGGELLVKDSRLPETALAALVGRRVEDLLAEDMLAGGVVRSIRNTPKGLVAMIDIDDVPYATLWQTMDGPA